MKGDKAKVSTFSISDIIKAKQKEFTSIHNSLKETNSALTKTKDYSKEDNILQNTFSGKFNHSKRLTEKNNVSKNNPFYIENKYIFKTKSYLSNNKSIHSKNLNLELKNIENILKYKDDANFNDSNYCESRMNVQEYDKISNDKTNIFSNSNLLNNFNKDKSKRTFSKVHRFKRSSMSSKFLNLYLGDIKNLSRDDSNYFNYNNNMLTQINLNINSLLNLSKAKNKKYENEFENITMLNISDSYLEDIDENSRIKIKRNFIGDQKTGCEKNYCLENKEGHNNNHNKNLNIHSKYNFDEIDLDKENKSKINDNKGKNYSINNITSKFNYVKNSNFVKFNLNVDNLTNTCISNNILNNIPKKLKKNRKNFINNNTNTNNNILIDDTDLEYKGYLTDEFQNTNKREDNTVVNLFNYLNFSDNELNNKNSNNLNFNFSSLGSENLLMNSNNFNCFDYNKNTLKDNNNYNTNNYNLEDTNYFIQSGNFHKLNSKSFKGSLSGISKITTLNHRNKHFTNQNNFNNINYDSSSKFNNQKTPKGKKINSTKKIILRSNENKLSNISILSIKSDCSDSIKNISFKQNTNEDNNLIIKKNNICNHNTNYNNSNSINNMSYYASDVDEFENQNEGNKLNVYNLEVKDQLIRLNTEDSVSMDKIESNYPNCKNLTDEKKKNSKKDFLKNFFDKENFDYDKNLPFYSKFNKNSSVKNMFALKNFNFLENEIQQRQQGKINTKNNNLFFLTDESEAIHKEKIKNKNLFFHINEINNKKIFYRNVSKKLRTVRLSSNPSYSELGQDVTFESDKIHKIQNFK